MKMVMFLIVMSMGMIWYVVCVGVILEVGDVLCDVVVEDVIGVCRCVSFTGEFMKMYMCLLIGMLLDDFLLVWFLCISIGVD